MVYTSMSGKKEIIFTGMILYPHIDQIRHAFLSTRWYIQTPSQSFAMITVTFTGQS